MRGVANFIHRYINLSDNSASSSREVRSLDTYPDQSVSDKPLRDDSDGDSIYCRGVVCNHVVESKIETKLDMRVHKKISN